MRRLQTADSRDPRTCPSPCPKRVQVRKALAFLILISFEGNDSDCMLICILNVCDTVQCESVQLAESSYDRVDGDGDSFQTAGRV